MQQIKSYPEASYGYNPDFGELEISLPWLKGQISLPRDAFNDPNEVTPMAIEAFLNSSKGYFLNQDLPFLPFCQAIPRPLSDFDRNSVLPKDKNEVSPDSPLSLLSILGHEDIPAFTKSTYWPNQWSWDADGLIPETKIENTSLTDPISIYTAIRRLRSMNQLESKYAVQFGAGLNELLLRDEPQFFKTVQRMLVQSYYITSKCTDSLSPALPAGAFGPETLSSYIVEEKGHDKLVLQSLRILRTANPDLEENVYPETVILMKALKYTAAHHPVAFCCLIGAFEQTAQFASDPLVDLLIQSSMPEAARGIRKHFQINKLGNHSEIGLQLVTELPPASITEALQAIRFSELYVTLSEGIAWRTINYMQINKNDR